MNIETINAMRAELEQFHAIAARSERLSLGSIDIERRRCGGYYVYYNTYELNTYVDRLAPTGRHESMANALAWLRSEAGLAAVNAAEAKGGRRE